MAVATVAELTEHTADYLEIVELGGRVFIRDGGEPVGELVPTSKAQHLLREVMAELPPGDVEAAQALFLGEGSIDQTLMSKVRETRERVQMAIPEPQDTLAARIAQLIAEGKARPPLEPLTDDFLAEPLPRFPGGSVLEELLAERRESRW